MILYCETELKDTLFVCIEHSRGRLDILGAALRQLAVPSLILFAHI